MANVRLAGVLVASLIVGVVYLAVMWFLLAYTPSGQLQPCSWPTCVLVIAIAVKAGACGSYDVRATRMQPWANIGATAKYR